MAGVLDSFVLSLVDPADSQLLRFASDVSPPSIYAIGLLVFSCVTACASGTTALLVVEKADDVRH